VVECLIPTQEKKGGWMTAEEALNQAVQALWAELTPEGHWEGRLSSSALAVSLAIIALCLNEDPEDRDIIDRGSRWLQKTQCEDGGWGDCPKSGSNPSTTLLVLSAYRIVGIGDDSKAILYLHKVLGNDIAAGIGRIYGNDHTFAAPILMTCALAGFVKWDEVPRLPYSLAVMPYRFYRLLRLQVVSYAMPALIAVGLAIDKRRGQRKLGSIVERKALQILEKLHPESGGFLEAVPLTAFVALSLLSMTASQSRPAEGGRKLLTGAADRVLSKSLSFLRKLQRLDGSWPIDTNLAIWVTSEAIDALRAAGLEIPAPAPDWLAENQTQGIHPFTHAEPGGWGWTDLSGAVPDGDDTAGVLRALSACAGRIPDPITGSAPCVSKTAESNKDSSIETERLPALMRKEDDHPFLIRCKNGLQWLINLQNADGGWPPFCRGWGKLTFDRSCTDITAHALRALLANGRGNCLQVVKGYRFLEAMQRDDGSWIPLWFGSQQTRNNENPVFGTSRVLMAYGEFKRIDCVSQSGIRYLLAAQNEDGGWGAAFGAASMIQESALAVSALSFFREQEKVVAAMEKGVKRLIEFIEQGGLGDDQPIGLYFAKLWYSEKLYPIIWTVKALALSIR
jgi:squalene-hopene/tetraprenyl-beta-curcumene cyclase